LEELERMREDYNELRSQLTAITAAATRKNKLHAQEMARLVSERDSAEMRSDLSEGRALEAEERLREVHEKSAKELEHEDGVRAALTQTARMLDQRERQLEAGSNEVKETSLMYQEKANKLTSVTTELQLLAQQLEARCVAAETSAAQWEERCALVESKAAEESGRLVEYQERADQSSALQVCSFVDTRWGKLGRAHIGRYPFKRFTVI
jgi:uncharacterized protein YigA (DUF484 family)